ncbi:MAG: M23 family metallopeptidase [Actinomycetota bacterium]|nr:M23 family metallopeptidase [Actinomycetota bacterium]
MPARAPVFAAFFMVAAMAAAMAALGTGARAQQAIEVPPTARTGGEVVGASIAHPEGWRVEREPYTFDGTYGFTLWRPGFGAEREHWGSPAMRLALAYDLEPAQIEKRVEQVSADYPELSVKRRKVDVAQRYEGVAVGPIPGSTPSTEVYVPVNGRVYLIDVYGEGLGEGGEELLRSVRFEPPSKLVPSLGLPKANAPEALYAPGDPQIEEAELAERAEPLLGDGTSGGVFQATARGGGERRIAKGCWRAGDGFYVQTQHGRYANRGGGDGIPTGRAVVGRPNYWHEFSHGRLGYGRCDRKRYTNDKFAVDYRLGRGDYVFSPFKRGKVTFAGRNKTHKDYGLFVSIKAANGRYVSLSGHLDGLRRGLDKGDRVTRKTVIGYAGDSDGPNFPGGRVHLHQAFYRKPRLNPDGSPYGGAALKVVRHHYVSGDGGVHIFGSKRHKGVKAKGSQIKN